MTDNLIDGSLEAVCHSAAELARTTRGALRRLRVRSGENLVELEWPDTAAGPAAVAAAEGPAPGTAAEDEPASDPDTFSIVAPMVGTFYRAPEPGAKPYVKPGDIVEAGQQVGILEAMKLMNPIEATRAGKVIEILIPDATAVEYAQPLILLAPPPTADFAMKE